MHGVRVHVCVYVCMRVRIRERVHVVQTVSSNYCVLTSLSSFEGSSKNSYQEVALSAEAASLGNASSTINS